MTAYRVIDVCLCSDDDMCYMYLRDIAGTRRVVKIPAVYELVLGSTSSSASVYQLMEEGLARHEGKTKVEWLGKRRTYYRGEKNLLRVSCKDYKTYDRLCSHIRFNVEGVFRCGSYSSVEEVTMMANGLYGALYVRVDGTAMSIAAPADEFPYSMSVGGFDLEMSNLDPVDPDSDLYMAAYYADGKYTIIYTSDYLAHDVPATATHTYVRVPTRADVALTLAHVIVDNAPDVLVGYNIYHADVPALYHALRKELLVWPTMSTSGPGSYYHHTRKLDKGYVDSETGLNVKIPGTHSLDMYPYLAMMTRDRTSLTLDDVSKDYLGDSKKPMGYRELMRIYHHGTKASRLRVMEYCGHDAMLPTKLYAKFNVDNYYTSNYSLTGIDPQKVMAHGSVSTTYGICYKEACSINAYMDDPNTSIFRPSGGLVLEPTQGMFKNVDCVDLTSLYPNIVIQHCVDTSALVPKREVEALLAHGLRDVFYYQVCVADPTVHVLRNRHGGLRLFRTTHQTAILPMVLERLLSSRQQLKKDIAACGDPVQKSILSGKELAAKTAANSACGALGEQTQGNPMAHCDLNDVVTTTGRTILSLAKGTAESMNIRVIYGDTDSLFIDSRGRTQEYIDAMHAQLPPRIRFKLEYTAEKFIMGNKKHYVTLVDGQVSIKGYKSTKSSKCPAAGKLFRWVLEILLEHGPEAAQQAYDTAVDTYCNDPEVDVKQLAHSYTYRGKDYSEGSHAQRLLAAMRSRGVDIVPGNTKYVVTVFTHEAYVSMYHKQPAIQLPYYSSYKAERIYTLEEVAEDMSLVDIRTILDTQCYGDLRSVLQAVYVQH